MTRAHLAALTGRARAICAGEARCIAVAEGRGLPALTVVGPWTPWQDVGRRLLRLSSSMSWEAEPGTSVGETLGDNIRYRLAAEVDDEKARQ